MTSLPSTLYRIYISSIVIASEQAGSNKWYRKTRKGDELSWFYIM